MFSKNMENFWDTIWIVLGLYFFTDTIWILFWDIEKWIVGPLGPLGPLGQAIRIFNPI